MKEDFLHYLWKYKCFATKALQTSAKKSLRIINVGEHNFNSGPDFFNANIRIGNQFWAGNVEIHINSSDWYRHKHEFDTNYDNVILHVVWKNDAEVYTVNNKLIPTLELSNFVSASQLSQYQTLFFNDSNWINCENQFNAVSEFTIFNWLEVLYFDRLEEKSTLIDQLLIDSSNDWEAVLFKLLAKSFGLKVNGEAFLNLANSIDYKIIRKEQSNEFQLEALFFGQAGFLEEEIDNKYHKSLLREYHYLKKKYQLESLNNGQFKFFRLRPNNFPTIRLVQLAHLYHKHTNLFSLILESESLIDIYELFTIKISGFWLDHYGFSSKALKRPKNITKSFIDLLIINTIIPLKFIYFKQLGTLNEDAILNIIREIKPEKNSIIAKFENLPVKNNTKKVLINNAFESQSYLQLKNKYCNEQRCLECAIGNELIKS